MGLLDILKATVQGTAAARTGYLAGEDEEQDKTRKDKLTALGIDRSSRLAAVAEQRAAADERRANAQADWYEKRDTTPKAAHIDPLSEEGIQAAIAREAGIAPIRAKNRADGTAAAGRIEANQHRVAMQQQIANGTRQIGEVDRQIGEAQKATGFKPGERKSRLDALAQMRSEFQRPRDSTVAAVRSPTFEAKARAAGQGVVPFDPVMPGTASGTASGGGSRVAVLRSAVAGSGNPAQDDYDAEAKLYQAATARIRQQFADDPTTMNARLKAASDRYNQRVAGVAGVPSP